MPIERSKTLAMRVLTVLLAVSSLSATATFAQYAPRASRHHEQEAMHQLRRVVGSLGLTSDQQAAIDTIFASRHVAAEAGTRESMAARKALADQIHAETLDEAAIRRAAAAVAAVEADRAVADATMLSEIRAQLTSEQRVQLQQALSMPERPMEPVGPMLPRDPYR